MSIKSTDILSQIICITLEDIRLWGARKKLNVDDLQIAGQLPPKDLASLGSKRIFNGKILNKFEALKKRAHTACAKVGIPFMGGYAVPLPEAENLAIELDKIGDEFAKTKSEFIANYDTELNKWIAEHAGWEDWIRRATQPVDVIESRISFGWTPARINTPSDNPNSVLNKKMDKETGGLAGRLFEDVAATAQGLEGSLLGKLRVNRRALSPIRTIRAKLNGLSMLDKRVKPLVDLIDQTLVTMPGDAPIEGVALTALNGVVLILSDKERMKAYGQAVIDGKSIDEVLAATPVTSDVVVATKPETATVGEAQQTVPVVAVVQEEKKPSTAIFIDNLFDDLVPMVTAKPEPVTTSVKLDAPVVSAEPQVQENAAALPASGETVPMVRIEVSAEKDENVFSGFVMPAMPKSLPKGRRPTL